MAHHSQRHHGQFHHGNGHTQTPTPTDPGPQDPPAGDTPPPTTTNAPDFAQLGATFNDATRALVGGLWQNAIPEAGQGNGSVVRYVNDLQTVQSGIQQEISAGQFSGDTLANAQAVLTDLSTAISAANASVTGGQTFGSVAAAETALRNSHLDILDIVNGDKNLSALATADGATGFTAAPPTLDGVSANNAPHANLAEIGAIFNDAANRILGGVNATNKGIISNDIHAVINDMKELMAQQPDTFSNLTGIHADTVVRQLELEFNYIKQAATNPDAARGSNDNILDIIDIVQGDPTLAQLANQGGISGFAPFPDASNPTPKYLDNAAQTNFWANFMADSNSLGQRAMEVVAQNDKAATHELITELKTFETRATDFDASQGGIFGARFDNELLGKTSTLGAEVDAMIKGLKTGNADLVAAAAEEMHANAADVSGNNLPNTGGTYNPDGLTVAQVLNTPAVASAATTAATTPAPTTNTAAPASPTVATDKVATNGNTVVAANNADDASAHTNATHETPQVHVIDHTPNQHFEHLWG